MLAHLQSVYKDNELEAHVILAQMFNDGWLPVQQTLSGKSVRAWLKEYHPEAAQHPAEALQVLLLRLKEQSNEIGKAMLRHGSCTKNMLHPAVSWVCKIASPHPRVFVMQMRVWH